MKHKSAAMADPTELHSFFHKFLNLWHAGKTACLSLECQAGEARLDLQLRLAHHHPPPLHPHQKSRPGPSRLRRRARRAEAREAAAAKVASAAVTATVDVAVQAASPVPPYKIDAAVQAAAPRTAEAAVQAGPVPQQLSAQIHPTLTAVQAGPTLHHPPRSHQAVQAGPVLQQHPTRTAVQVYKLAQFINNILHKLILPGLLYKLFQLSTTLRDLTRLHDQADFMQLHDQFLLQPLSGILL